MENRPLRQVKFRLKQWKLLYCQAKQLIVTIKRTYSQQPSKKATSRDDDELNLKTFLLFLKVRMPQDERTERTEWQDKHDEVTLSHIQTL